jgi:hypothetical protein
MPCIPGEVHRRVGGKYYLYLQSRILIVSCLLGLLLGPEDGGSMLFRNDGKLAPDYKALHLHSHRFENLQSNITCLSQRNIHFCAVLLLFVNTISCIYILSNERIVSFGPLKKTLWSQLKLKQNLLCENIHNLNILKTFEENNMNIVHPPTSWSS